MFFGDTYNPPSPSLTPPPSPLLHTPLNPQQVSPEDIDALVLQGQPQLHVGVNIVTIGRVSVPMSTIAVVGELSVLCCVVLCCAVLCCTVLCCAGSAGSAVFALFCSLCVGCCVL